MFICDKCGVCCRHLERSDLYKSLNRGDGVCKFLDEKTNLCKIYENRPEICNVEKMYEIYFSSKMTKENYYRLNYAACEKLKRGIYVSFASE
ncbi:MAG: YkgJ family cysteine cluster protein [Treponema sp.]|nr:YkgJ family cysteine cluster protein [Treponema sp.]